MSDFININEKLCTGCGLCAKVCIEQRISFLHGTAHAEKNCFMCGHCIAVCPANAIKCTHPDFCTDDIEEVSHALNAEEFLRAVKSRRSIRNFQNKPVDHKDIERILEAARWSETARNLQKAKFIVIDDNLDEYKDAVWETWKQLGDAGELGKYKESGFADQIYENRKNNPKDDALFFNAPCLILITGFDPIDTGIQIANLEHMAVSMGMGILVTGFLARIFKSNKDLYKKLNVGEGTELMECILLGYPSVKYLRTTPHKKLNIEYL